MGFPINHHVTLSPQYIDLLHYSLYFTQLHLTQNQVRNPLLLSSTHTRVRGKYKTLSYYHGFGSFFFASLCTSLIVSLLGLLFVVRSDLIIHLGFDLYFNTRNGLGHSLLSTIENVLDHSLLNLLGTAYTPHTTRSTSTFLNNNNKLLLQEPCAE